MQQDYRDEIRSAMSEEEEDRRRKEALNMSGDDPRWRDAQREMDERANYNPSEKKMPLEGYRESENVEDRRSEKPMDWMESIYHNWRTTRDWRTPKYRGGPPRYHPSDIVYDDMRVDESKPAGAYTGTGNVMEKEHTVMRPQDAARERREQMKELNRTIGDPAPRDNKRKS